MKLFNNLVSGLMGRSIAQLQGKIFSSLVNSKAFRKTVVETEKAVLRGIRFAGDPQKEGRAFHKSESEAVDYLAQKARDAAAEKAKATQAPRAAPQVPHDMTASGYQPESEMTRWIKTKKYELGVFKTKWFG